MFLGSQLSPLDEGISAWPAGKPLMGSYRGFGRVASQSTITMDRLIGYKLPLGLGFLDYSAPLNMAFNAGDPVTGSGGAVGGYKTNNLRSNVIVRVPLAFTDGTTCANVAAGTYDARYTTVFNALVTLGYPNAILSLGHEMNYGGSGKYPWAGAGNEASFVSAFQHISTLARGISGANFKIFWNPAQKLWGYLSASHMSAPADAWPGATYVDYVGIDLYDESQFSQTDAQLRWDRELLGNTGTAITGGNTLPYCLAWIAQWGQTYGKPVIIGEGSTGFNASAAKNWGDNPTFWTNWVNWVHDPANNVYAHNIFDCAESGNANNNYSISLSSSITGIAPNNLLDEKPNAATTLRNAMRTKLAA